MNIVINEDLKAYIDPLTPDEHDALERSLLVEGCRDALVLWGEVLVDGHNRYGICQKHGIPFQTVQNPRFQSIEDVHLWMIDQHLGRRSVSSFQRGLLALRKREILGARRAAQQAGGDAVAAGGSPFEGAPVAAAALPPADPLDSREALARAAKLSNSQVVMIEKIQKQATPELVAAVRAGTLSINAAAAVASLPADEQVAATQAGADELKLVARRVRDARRRPRDPDQAKVPERHLGAGGGGEAGVPLSHVDAAAGASIAALQRRIAELSEENELLQAEVAQLRQRLGLGRDD